MTPRAPQPPSPEALFRHQVVSQIVVRMRGGRSRASAVREVAGQTHLTLSGEPRTISTRTAYRWLRAYDDDGLAGLEPTRRPRVADSVVLSRDLLAFLRQERADDRDASIPELIRRARQHGVVDADEAICRQTVYRAMKRMGLPTARRKSMRKGRDTRRFAFAHRMQMVLCDGKHFRAGPTRVKRVALFFLDDATRYGLHVVVGTSESASLFLRGLYEMIGRHGLFDAIYLDGGPGFIAHDTARVVRKGLDRLLLHGEKGYPEGRGKVERFNRTAKADVLRHLSDPRVDPDCGALALRLQHYLSEVYNLRPHESLGGMSPATRWNDDDRPLCWPDDEASLRARFTVTEQRRVSNDHVIRVGPDHLEVPRGLAGERVDIHRHVLDGTVCVLHEGRRVVLHPVDPAANATSRRGRPDSDDADDVVHPLPPSAATLAHDRDLGPIVGPDGGFTDHEE